MTRTHHHISSTYITAYQDELRTELTTAYRAETPFKRTRRSAARTLVRFGAWLFPETPEIVDGRIIVLTQPIDRMAHDQGALDQAA